MPPSKTQRDRAPARFMDFDQIYRLLLTASALWATIADGSRTEPRVQANLIILSCVKEKRQTKQSVVFENVRKGKDRSVSFDPLSLELRAGPLDAENVVRPITLVMPSL
jgi:hypothetical protein